MHVVVRGVWVLKVWNLDLKLVSYALGVHGDNLPSMISVQIFEFGRFNNLW